MQRLIYILFLSLQVLFVHGRVRLPAMISDKMILQRDTELKIWGWADNNEKVTVRFRGQYYCTEANQDGNWSVLLPAQAAGGPFIMEVNDLVIRDILFGDVWLCSGQSNMETPIQRLLDKYPEINVSNNNMIRYFKVPTQNIVQTEQENISYGNKWFSGVASEVIQWTALAYFYAQEAYLHTKVPQGMLVSSLGGSAIESWISQEGLKEFPKLQFDRQVTDSISYLEKDQGIGLWTQADWDDRDWLSVNMPNNLRNQGIDNRGVVYFRKSIEIPQDRAGRHAKLYLGMMIDSDSVFVNGHFVGSTSYQYPPRKYDIPAGVLKMRKNSIVIRLRADSGNGEFVRDKDYRLQIDDYNVDLKGDWKYKIAIDLVKLGQYKSKALQSKFVGSGLYNGMIYPLRNYSIKGVLWYQGESNVGSPQGYQHFLELLISNWRSLWADEKLPFLIVQLPNFMSKNDVPTESGWAGIREAQLKVSRQIPRTALAVTYDIGEWNDIHPLNKKDLAKRLFLGARSIVYQEKISAFGPRFKNAEIQNDKIVIFFEEDGELQTKDKKSLRHFAIAGADRKFVWANAVIKGNKIIVSHPNIHAPVSVRYAWADNPEDANLINKSGLLASPFRTDNW